MPLPTAPGLLGDSLPQDTPTPAPAHHPLVGTWLLTFDEGDQTPAQMVFGDDGLVLFTDAGGNRGAGVWIPRGERSGIVAVAVRGAETSSQPRPITVLQGTIDVGTSGNTVTLHYTTESIEESRAPAERAGPFTASGQRVSE